MEPRPRVRRASTLWRSQAARMGCRRRSGHLELIGKHADGWLTYVPGAAEDNPEVFAEQVRDIRRHAERAGRDPHSIAIATTLLTIIHPDENFLDEVRDHPIVRWNAMLATPTARVHRQGGLNHPYGDDWTFSRDCIPPWISREEALDVASRTPREAVDRTHLVGTAEQVREKFGRYARRGSRTFGSSTTSRWPVRKQRPRPNAQPTNFKPW